MRIEMVLEMNGDRDTIQFVYTALGEPKTREILETFVAHFLSQAIMSLGRGSLAVEVRMKPLNGSSVVEGVTPDPLGVVGGNQKRPAFSVGRSRMGGV
jgi:hypothetical protein